MTNGAMKRRHLLGGTIAAATFGTRARAAGFATEYRTAGADRVLSATQGSAAAVIYLRERDGQTEVDLVTSGG